ncbi:MAG: 4Fe-4S dicluster domain-containing protein [Caldilineae bacterium]|nr:MAG: 4Fe-4S dicluster domain-containing protein [Caldilineae bacterium]
MTNEKYQVRVPDLDYYREQIKCQVACPVHTDARGYVTAIAAGDFEAAYRMARDPNPLASICGRVCNAPCEIACRRGDIDAPVAIRPLKRVVTERYGVESAHPIDWHRDMGRAAEMVGNLTARSYHALSQLARQPGRRQGRVAVIGSGPAGLACAHDLALLGHQVVIYDAAPASGGMLRFGIPLYRLSRALLDREIQSILDLGIELRLNTPVGREVSFAQLREEYDAVFIATGLGEGRSLRIPGADLDGVLKAVDFLLNVNMGYKVDLGRRVIVIGGGNVAADAARMALRQQRAGARPLTELDQVELEREAASAVAPGEDESLHAAVDVARTAVRLGVPDVRMIALESWEELPASEIEIEESLEEGIQIFPGYGPNRILGEKGRVVGLETLDVASVFDKDGRFNPQFVPNSEKTWECDTIILAIGQAANLDFLGQDHGVEISPRGLIVVDEETGATSAPGVYAGGDVVYGPRILIEAVRDGQRAARAIDGQIQQKRIRVQTQIHWRDNPNHRMPEGYTKRPRIKPPTLPLERRIGIDEVEQGYDTAQAIAQAERCLNCGINTVFDGTKCILCNGCVDVCPWSCLKIVRVADLAGDEALEAVVRATFGCDIATLAAQDIPATAMLKDDDLCTRCGLCARRCPTGAITMETFSFAETLAYEEA